MTIRSLILVVITGFIANLASAQTDSLRRLDGVVITGDRLATFSVGNRVERIDSSLVGILEHSNLGNVLSRYSSANIRSYGISGLSTASLRGAGASHTTVLWNGISLQSPASGELDLTLIPSAFIDDVSVQLGGSSTLYGSGAIGGTIHLNNDDSNFGDGLTLGVNQTIGSFGTNYSRVSAKVSMDKVISSVKLFRNTADNDFTFINDFVAGRPEQHTQHAGIDQFGILQENYFKLNENNTLKLRWWYQDNEVQIPSPSSVSRVSEAVQMDEFLRLNAEWEHNGERVSVIARTAYLKHDLRYEDPLIDLISNSQVSSFISEVESRVALGRTAINVGINNTYDQSSSDGFGTFEPDRNRTALFSSAKFKSPNQRFNSVLSGRVEQVDGDLTPFVPSFGFEFFPVDGMSLRGNIARNYNIPTFNQLHWAGVGGVGNPNLRPETGWSQEIGLGYFPREGLWGDGLSFEADLTYYNSNITDWILWAPISGSDWSPQNLISVWSRGVETVLKTAYRTKGMTLDVTANYNYTRTTNEEVAENASEEQVGKQLIYVPLHSGNVNLNATWNRVSFNYAHNWFGKQYTTADNLEVYALDGYQVGNVALSYPFNTGGMRWLVKGLINNIWNENYQVRSARHMPLRNYQLSLILQFKTKPN
ncbi:MAG: TonB-dependent receptor [Bacteroidota bacterium]